MIDSIGGGLGPVGKARGVTAPSNAFQNISGFSHFSSNGTSGSACRSVAVLDDGAILQSSGNTGAIYRSADNGASWEPPVPLASENRVDRILSLGNNIVLAGTQTNAYVFRSTNGGVSWTKVLTSLKTFTPTQFVSLGNGTVLAINKRLVYRSINYGLTWTTASPELPVNIGRALDLALMDNGNILLATGSGYAEIYRSTDAGSTWQQTYTLGTLISAPSCASIGNGVAIAGLTNTYGIWRTTDYGTTWSLAQTIPGSSVEILSLIHLGDGIALAGTNTSQIWKSLDGGISWTLLCSTPGPVYQFAIKGNDVLASTLNQVWKSYT